MYYLEWGFRVYWRIRWTRIGKTKWKLWLRTWDDGEPNGNLLEIVFIWVLWWYARILWGSDFPRTGRSFMENPSERPMRQDMETAMIWGLWFRT